MAGEIVSITGPSGSGKSTLLASLAGLIAPREGTVQFRGDDIAGLSESARSALRLRDFGFVFQFGDLVPELTLLENVELPLRFGGVRRSAAARADAQAIMAVLGIQDLAQRKVYEVSGGEMQRAAVARALVHSPAVVFADEPTGSLDEANGAVVLDSFLHAAKDRGASVLLATHDADVARLADRRFALRGGYLEQQP